MIQIAKDNGIKGYTTLKKAELVRKLEREGLLGKKKSRSRSRSRSPQRVVQKSRSRSPRNSTELPNDVLYEIGLKTERPEDVLNQCMVNKSFSKRCNDSFWKEWYNLHVGDEKLYENFSWKINSFLAFSDYGKGKVAIIIVSDTTGDIRGVSEFYNKFYTNTFKFLNDLADIQHQYYKENIINQRRGQENLKTMLSQFNSKINIDVIGFYDLNTSMDYGSFTTGFFNTKTLKEIIKHMDFDFESDKLPKLISVR